MIQITVSDDIARQISGAVLPIVLVDSHGRALGRVSREDVLPTRTNSKDDAAEDEWAEAKRRIEQAKRDGGTFYTTNEVLEHLKSLERQ